MTLRQRFERAETLCFGLEEEVFLVDAESFELSHRAQQLVPRLSGNGTVKLELPASQIELVTPPRQAIPALIADLAAARARVSAQLGAGTLLLASGTHPFAAPEGPTNDGPHYERVAAEYGSIACRQLVCGMHVHVTLPGAARVLAVYNAARSYLPLLAALAANAPLHDGRDTGLASVRPLIAGMLPRQGIPPLLSSWDELAGALQWGARTGRLNGVSGWWWELRLHPELGTIEIRAPDTQTSLAEAAAVAAVAAALVLWLARRHDAGDLEPPVRSWRIAENRWSALRDGTAGTMFDLQDGRARATAELIGELIGELRAVAEEAGVERQLVAAERLLQANGAERQRRLLRETGDLQAVVAALTRCYQEDPDAG